MAALQLRLRIVWHHLPLFQKQAKQHLIDWITVGVGERLKGGYIAGCINHKRSIMLWNYDDDDDDDADADVETRAVEMGFKNLGF